MICSRCGRENPNSTAVCPGCGAITQRVITGAPMGKAPAGKTTFRKTPRGFTPNKVKNEDGLPAMHQEKFTEYVMSTGGWVCRCGRINNSYVGTCVCKRRKRDILRSNKKINDVNFSVSMDDADGSVDELPVQQYKNSTDRFFANSSAQSQAPTTPMPIGKNYANSAVQPTRSNPVAPAIQAPLVAQPIPAPTQQMQYMATSPAPNIPMPISFENPDDPYERTVAVRPAMNNVPTMAPSASPAPGNINEPAYIAELRRLKELADAGIITQADYELKKKQILGL